MESNPGKILQNNGIEVSPDDPRTTQQILADMINNGVIKESVILPDSCITAAMILLAPICDIALLEDEV